MGIRSLQNNGVRAFGLLVLVGVLGVGWLLVIKPKQSYAQNTGSPATKIAFGLETTTFKTSKGNIQVNLPDDVAAGDSISGTVVADPAGKTDKERAKNQDELNGYVVETQNNKTSVAAKTLKWAIPAAAATGVTYLILRDRGGNEVARTPVPVQPNPPPLEPSSVPTANAFHLPTIGQAGRPLQISGPFDGNSSTTAVTIGGKEAPVLAESPRKTVVQSPASIVGPTDIRLTKGSVETTGTLRNVAIKLTSTKTQLRTNETATLTADVTGLTGLASEIPLQIANESSSVVGLTGGDKQVVTIQPQDVSSDGSYLMTRTLTGRQVGSFDIVALVSDLSFAAAPTCTIAGGNCPHECKFPSQTPGGLSSISVVPKGQGMNINIEKAIEDAESSDKTLSGLSLTDLIASVAETVVEGDPVPPVTGVMAHATIEHLGELKERLHKLAQERWGKVGDVEVKVTFICKTCTRDFCHNFVYWCLTFDNEWQETWSSAPKTIVVPPPAGLTSDNGQLWAGGTFDPSQAIVARAIQDAVKNGCK